MASEGDTLKANSDLQTIPKISEPDANDEIKQNRTEMQKSICYTPDTFLEEEEEDPIDDFFQDKAFNFLDKRSAPRIWAIKLILWPYPFLLLSKIRGALSLFSSRQQDT